MDPSKTRVWESLKADARQLDTEIESKLSILENIALGAAEEPTAVARFEAASDDVEQRLRKMQTIVQSMHDAARCLSNTPEGNTMQKHTQRFDELLQEKQKVVRRLANDLKRRRERHELLSKVQTEINVYNESSDVRQLSSEQDSLRYTQRRLNDILTNADTSREKLRAQRQLFTDMGDKAVQIVEKMPFVNGVLKRIDAKRRREVVIVGGLMSFLMMLVVVFW
jgi:Golgi SNAP receptor complex protein 1